MNRFFGMMPVSEIELNKHYKDKYGNNIIIQAGSHGWTIIYADSSSEYEDIDATTEINFNTAVNIAVERLGELKEYKKSVCCEM